MIKINTQLQNKIKEAKELLEKYAPPGEHLAYINKEEAELLKKHGGAGVKIPETNIPSYFYWYAAALAVGTVASYMGSLRQAKAIKTANNWDKYNKEQKRIYEKIQLNKQAADLLSEKKARTAASGFQFTGSSLLAEQEVIEDYEDKLYFLNEGINMQISTLDTRTNLALNKEAYERNTNLITNSLMTRGAYQAKV